MHPLHSTSCTLSPTHPFANHYTPSQSDCSPINISTSPPSPTSSHRGSTKSLPLPVSPRSAHNHLHGHAKAPIALPADLSLFDPKPRQTLLNDLEFIAGKRLTFPLIDKMTQKLNKARGEGDTRARNDSRQKQSLEKPRHPEREYNFVCEGPPLLGQTKVGRGVREGNRI
jgi:hypothetical protein